MIEYYCPYCRAWINETVHRQHHHNDLDEPDEIRDWRVRSDGVVYEDEEEEEEEVESEEEREEEEQSQDESEEESG